MKNTIRRLLALCAALALLAGPGFLQAAAASGEAAPAAGAARSGELVADTAGKITVDGAAKDWETARLPVLTPGNKDNNHGLDVTDWRIARDTAGRVYICIRGLAPQGDDYRWMSLVVTQGNVTQTQLINTLIGVRGGDYAYACAAADSDPAPFVLELSLPVEYFDTPRYTVTFDGVSVPAASIPVLNNVEPEEDAAWVYRGITVDGSYEDWAAVLKSPAACPNESHPNCIDQTAMVFDGDWIYVYIHESAENGAALAGSADVGRYAITTDTGESLVLALLQDGSTRGVNGVEAAHVGSQWELAIPAGELPAYESSIAFGLNGETPFVSNVVNLDGSSGSAGAAGEITIDGRYSDWADFPHTVMQNADGTADSTGALYLLGDKLYGHVSTTGAAHLASNGADFLWALSLAFSGAEEVPFVPQLVFLDEQQRPTSYQQGEALEPGNHLFYICPPGDLDYNSAEELQAGALGELRLTVNGYRDELEFQLNLAAAAGAAGLRQGAIREIALRLDGLSLNWLRTAGTSSGPALGAALCLTAAGLALWGAGRRKKAGAR